MFKKIDELHLIHQQIGFLMDENRNQNHEIALLKEIVGRNGKSSFLQQTLVNKEYQDDDQQQMERKIMFGPRQSSDELGLQRAKRPARLLPFSLLFGDRKNETDAILQRRFYGPPTNCSDLTRLGYTLNGFYLVKPMNNNNDTGNSSIIKDTKLYTVFCSFKQAEGANDPSNVEKRVGNLQLDAGNSLNKPNKGFPGRGIHFHVQRNINMDFSNKGINTIITFDVNNLNLGEAFNGKSGIFTVPKPGVYQFVFKGPVTCIYNKQSMMSSFNINLYVNNAKFGSGTAMVEENRDVIVMIESTIQLRKGDKVHVGSETMGIQSATLYGVKATSFSGSLLEELDQ